MALANVMWSPIYDNTNIQTMTANDAAAILKMLYTTSVEAQRYYQNPNGPIDKTKFGPAGLINKVAYVSPKNNINYMKVSVARDTSVAGTPIAIVILYQWMNHRSQWCSSITFDPKLVPAPGTGAPGNPTAAYNQYVALARNVSSRLYLDLTSFTPSGYVSTMYDDVTAHNQGVSPVNQANRRQHPIGELGWIAQQDNFVGGLFSVAINQVPVAGPPVVPKNYYLPGAQSIVLTTLTAVKNAKALAKSGLKPQK